MSEKCETFAGAVTVGDRGQVVIPAHVRQALGLVPGKRLLALRPPGSEALVLVGIEHLEEAIAAMGRLCREEEAGPPPAPDGASEERAD